MADINNKIIVNVDDNASEPLERIGSNLDKVQSGHTKITQSTKNLTKETSNLNEGLLKNGGAMGLLSAATGGLAMDFKDAIEAIELTGVSLKGLRGAIIATGIGALAIAVLELVTNWDKWVGVIDGSTAAMERLNTQQAIFNEFKTQQEINQSEEITNLEENVRLLTAQGAAKQDIIDAENQLSEARRASAEALLYGLGAEKGLFDLRQQYADLLETLTEGTDKYNDVLKQYNDNEKAINEQLKIRAAAINDPKVRAAEEETAKRNKLNEESLKRQREEQEKIKNLLLGMASNIKVLQDTNDLLKGISVIDLSSNYGKFKQLTDAYYKTRDALRQYTDSLSALTNLGVNNLNPQQEKEMDDLVVKSKLYMDNFEIINKLLTLQKVYIEDNIQLADESKDQFIAIQRLKLQYDLLNNSIMDYERLSYGKTGNEKLDNINRINDALLIQFRIIEQQRDLDKSANTLKINQLEKEKDIIAARQMVIKSMIVDNESVGGLIQRVQEDLKQGRYTKLTENQEKIVKEYFDNQDKIRDYKQQSSQLLIDNDKINAQAEIDINKAKVDALVEQERMALDAKMVAQEDYHNKLQILQSNLYGFMDQLQNEQIIKSKDLRNVLLVAQKGAEIAGVVINTVRENSKLKMQAGNYATNAALYGALATSLAPVDPIASASYGAAASAYAVGGSKSLAQIPLNWGIAGVSIASILATTLTSWNRNDGGSGGNSGGGGAGSAAQFNIVGASGNNQLAAAIAAQQNQPVNAYVVGSDMTTQQALDRNRITNATFL